MGTGRLLACGADLRRPGAGPGVRQLLASLLTYARSERFAPAVALTPADLDGLVRPLPEIARRGATVRATSEQAGYPADAAIDGDPATLWHTGFGANPPRPPHDSTLRFATAVPLAAWLS